MINCSSCEHCLSQSRRQLWARFYSYLHFQISKMRLRKLKSKEVSDSELECRLSYSKAYTLHHCPHGTLMQLVCLPLFLATHHLNLLVSENTPHYFAEFMCCDRRWQCLCPLLQRPFQLWMSLALPVLFHCLPRTSNPIDAPKVTQMLLWKLVT